MRINTEHMKKGVTIEDINTTYIYDDVNIGMDTVIHPNTTIKSGVTIGEDCEIGPSSVGGQMVKKMIEQYEQSAK